MTIRTVNEVEGPIFVVVPILVSWGTGTGQYVTTAFGVLDAIGLARFQDQYVGHKLHKCFDGCRLIRPGFKWAQPVHQLNAVFKVAFFGQPWSFQLLIRRVLERMQWP
jgi:hypothetical protein